MKYFAQLLSMPQARLALSLLFALMVQVFSASGLLARDSRDLSLRFVGSPKSSRLFQYSLSHTDGGTELLLSGQGDMDLTQNRSFYLHSPYRFILDIRCPKEPKGDEIIPIERAELKSIRFVCHPDKIRLVFRLPEDPQVKCTVISDANSLRVFIGKNPPPEKALIPDTGMQGHKEVEPTQTAKPDKDLQTPRDIPIGQKSSPNGTISCSLVKADLSQFFTLLSQVSGKEIKLSQDVKGQISIGLDGVPWDQALEMVSKLYKLEVSKREGYLFVAPSAKR